MKTQCPGPLDEGDAGNCGENFINRERFRTTFLSSNYEPGKLLLERKTNTCDVSYVSLVDTFRHVRVMFKVRKKIKADVFHERIFQSV